MQLKQANNKTITSGLLKIINDTKNIIIEISLCTTNKNIVSLIWFVS